MILYTYCKLTSKFCLFSRYDKGGYLFLPSYVMRTHGSRKQQDAMRKTPPQQMQKVFEVQLNRAPLSLICITYFHFIVAQKVKQLGFVFGHVCNHYSCSLFFQILFWVCVPRILIHVVISLKLCESDLCAANSMSIFFFDSQTDFTRISLFCMLSRSILETDLKSTRNICVGVLNF